MEYEQLKLENQLCFPFYAVSRLIIRAYQEDLERLGITYPQYLVLMVLWEKDGISVNEIAEKLILNTNTVTPLLKRMEAMQLITRTPSTMDQRKIIIQLTDQGWAMRESAAEIPLKLMSKLNLEVSDVQIAEALLLKNKLYELIKVLDKSSN
ncbi:MAG: MarR family transcriptional regulator [Paludibacter sp.]|nr:MarR family transcriptional regulator [Paludibacter sp.]